MIDSFLRRYSELVTEHPFAVLITAVVTIAFLGTGAQFVETEDQDVSDFLPEKYAPITAFETIDAEFGSAEATTYTILLEVEPVNGSSDEIADVRDPEFLRYVSKISSEAEKMQKVSSVGSPASLFKEIPKEKRTVIETMEKLGEERWSQYISDDFTAAKMTVEASGISVDEELEVADDLSYNIESSPKPSGVELTYTGQTFIDRAFQNESGNTQQLTSTVALLLVVVVVIALFRSATYGLMSLEALIFGIIAGYGLFGWLGFNLSPSTSGAISIGIGIAVDFGIQPVARYREERKEMENGMKKSLYDTLSGIARPMTLGLIAAIMGFSSLSLGDITFLSSLGVILSLTTLMAYFAAFTIIPPTLIIQDRYLDSRVKTVKTNLRSLYT